MTDKKANILIILGSLAGLLLLINSILLVSINSTLNNQIQLARDAAIPAQLEIITLTTPSCPTCHNVSLMKSQLTDSNITSDTELEYESSSARQLIEKYNITKLPAMIIKGETTKSSSLQKIVSDIGVVNEDGSVLVPAFIPPFLDAATGKQRGSVSLVVLSPSDCEKCFDISQLVAQLKSTLTIGEFLELDSSSDEGRALLTRYQIDILPTIVIDKEASVYPMISEVWPLVGTVEDDGSYVMRNVNPPYYNLSSEKMEGLVDLTILTDAACSSCYDAAKINKAILVQMGIIIENEKALDISSAQGQALVSRYQITRVPTIVLQGDMAKYQALTASWGGVGTVEDDGSYVLRRLEIFEQPYKDLSTGEIINPTPSAPDASVVPVEPVPVS